MTPGRPIGTARIVVLIVDRVGLPSTLRVGTILDPRRRPGTGTAAVASRASGASRAVCARVAPGTTVDLGIEQHQQVGITLIDLNSHSATVSAPRATRPGSALTTIAAGSTVCAARPLRGVGPIVALAARFTVATTATMSSLATTRLQTHQALHPNEQLFLNLLRPLAREGLGPPQHDGPLGIARCTEQIDRTGRLATVRLTGVPSLPPVTCARSGGTGVVDPVPRIASVDTRNVDHKQIGFHNCVRDNWRIRDNWHLGISAAGRDHHRESPRLAPRTF
jgi:hypothetical protein